MAILCSSSFAILFAVFTFVSTSDEWHYGHEDQWPGVCATGTAQSPIDLDSEASTYMIYHAFEFINYDTPFTATEKNNGHSIAITLNVTDGNKPAIFGAGLNGEYVLDHLHFHWQSEHTVRDYRYPLEMHLVHYSNKYDSLAAAANFAGGVAVLGVLFDVSIDDDKDFVPLIEVIESVQQTPDVDVPLQREITARSFLPRNTGDYFRYEGSLTTPDCNEGVIWTVFRSTLPMSADQIQTFKSIWSGDGPLTLNYRSVQPLNGRQIYLRTASPGIPGSDFDPSAAPTSTVSVAALILAILAIKMY